MLAGCGKPENTPAPVAPSVVTYERGRMSVAAVTGSPSRNFSEPSPAEKAVARRLCDQLKQNLPVNRVQELLSDARTLESTALLDVASQLHTHTDPEARILGLTLVEGFDSPDIVSLVNRAMKDANDDVRIEAMEVAQHVTDASVYPLLLAAMEDGNLSVRQLALQTATSRPDEIKSQAIARAATSTFEDMANAGLAHLEARPSKMSISLAMRALDHTHQSVRQQAHELLFLTTHQSFRSHADAQAWWTRNQDAFDDDLVIIDPERFIRR